MTESEALGALGQAVVEAPPRDRDELRRKLFEALCAAIPERRSPRLMADFAVRLAQLGHARRVSVTVADTHEAVQAACSFFAERSPADGARDGLKTLPEALQADPSMTADDLWPVYLDNAERAAELAPGAPETPAAQRGPGDAQEGLAEASGNVPTRGGGVICGPPSVIPTGIVGEIRDALASGPLSFRELRARIGRGWRPARAALGALVDFGEVARDGERGRGVRFRLVVAADASNLEAAGGCTDASIGRGLSILPVGIYAELAEPTDAPDLSPDEPGQP